MYKICWNEAKTVGIIVNEGSDEHRGLTYELRKGALNTLGVVSADFVEAWGDMTAEDNCTVEEIDLAKVAQLGGSPEDLRNVLCGVIEIFGIEGAQKITEYALKFRGINAFDGKPVASPAPQTHAAGSQPIAWQPKYKPEFLEYLRGIRGDMDAPLVFFQTKREAEDYGHGGHDARPLYAHPPSASVHPDDIAVDRFAAAMKAKLARKRAEGRGGWDNPDECSLAFLSELLRSHVEKGDPVDVGNFAMMIHQREGAIE